jgi:hypothetical protein
MTSFPTIVLFHELVTHITFRAMRAFSAQIFSNTDEKCKVIPVADRGSP